MALALKQAALCGRAPPAVVSRSRSPLRRTRGCAALSPSSQEVDLLAAGCPVPEEQQPFRELQQVQEMSLVNWATLPAPEFAKKLATVWAGAFAAGLPVSAFTFDMHRELLQACAASSVGSCFVATVLVWRIYLGWQHVGDRLMSATVEYEESGWYDGQRWVKTPQMLMRDRLLSNYTVKPALDRLKRTLLGLGGALAASVLLLATVPPPAAYSSSAPAASYAAPAAAATAAAADADYEATLQRFEPWALEEGEQGEGGAAPAYDMRSHMQAAGGL